MSSMEKDVMGFGRSSVVLGVTGAITSGLGGTGSAGVNAAAGMMPMVGTAMMGKHVIKQVKKINKK